MSSIPSSTEPPIELSPFQERALSVPEQYDLFLGGGRGGAKSHCAAHLVLRHVEQYGAKARILYIRKTYKGIADFEAITRDVFWAIYGPAARYNQTEHIWRFPSGAYFELGQLDGPGDYGKYQGRSFTLIIVDEACQYADLSEIDRLRSNMRGPRNIPLRFVVVANPGDVGHGVLAARYVFNGSKPWEPFVEKTSGRTFVSCPSTYLDNPFIDQAEYLRSLEASCPGDPELLKAWVTGDWAVSVGAFFAGVLDEERNAIDPWDGVPRGWDGYLAHDWGSSAPSVTYVLAKSPGAVGPDGYHYPRGSIVAVAELATNRPGRLNEGTGLTVPRLAEEIIELARDNGIKPRGCADDSCFARHRGYGSATIADEFRQAGVRFWPAKKGDRQTGWERMRIFLQNAGEPDVPGLYISRACEYFWASVPYLARDRRKPQDVDTDGIDHAADAIRYGLLYRKMVARSWENGARRARDLDDLIPTKRV